MIKERSPDQTVVSISLSKDVKTRIDARAEALGISRSSYLSLLAQHDLTKGGPLPILVAGAPEPPAPLDLTMEAYDFLLLAIPALEEYDRQINKLPAKGHAPEPPDELAESRLWQFFLHERDEILRYKWLQSEKEGRDIGLSRAVQEWLRHHRLLWARAHPPARD